MEIRTNKAAKHDRNPEKFFLVWKCRPDEAGPEKKFGDFGAFPCTNTEDPAGVYKLETHHPQPQLNRN
jgi:hypothetical protein